MKGAEKGGAEKLTLGTRVTWLVTRACVHSSTSSFIQFTSTL